MARSRPDLSVLVPAFGHGRFLAECLESVLAQTGVSLEVIVSDNASTDETPEVAARFAARDARVRVVRQPENLGYARNVNWLLAAGRGRHLALLGSDDRLLDPEALLRAVRRLDAAPNAAYLHAAYQEVDGEGRPLRLMRYYETERCDPGEEALVSLLGLRYPWISATVVPRAVVERAGGFDLACEYAWDIAWFWALAEEGVVLYEPRAAVTYRQHGTSLSGSRDRDYKRRHLVAALESVRPRYAGRPHLSEACDRSLERLRAELAADTPVDGAAGEEEVRARAEQRLAERIARWRCEGTRVAVYGAGMHTRELLAAQDFRGVRLVGFADRDPAYANELLAGVRIVRPQQLASLGPEEVLVSSRCFEAEIVGDLVQLLGPEVGLSTLYDATLSRSRDGGSGPVKSKDVPGRRGRREADSHVAGRQHSAGTP